MAPSARKQGNGSADQGKGRRIFIILCGFIALFIGAILMLQSYSTHPTKFNIGFVLAFIGFVAVVIAALITDRRRPDHYDNGKPGRRS